ncbi:MAG: hypothetical protein A2W25_08155 [candidate division Zixibacteria bacterium RBG_16_53_22]|nr:MAG: hypothetical protein A2W25_08155 [candidate division Zixibacteria bacterium RBG_16_53_22]
MNILIGAILSAGMIIFIPTAAPLAQQGWHRQVSGTSHTLNSLKFTELTTGTVVGDSNIILHTTDSGETWVAQTTVPFLSLKDICSAGPDTLFAIGMMSVDPFYATIIRTNDGGNAWAVIYQEMMASFTRIRMCSAMKGFISGNSGFFGTRVLRTCDGWGTLEVTNFEFLDPEGHYDESISFDRAFSDSMLGFIAAGIWDGDGAVGRCDDGGITWSTNFWCDDVLLFAVDCPSHDTIFVAGMSGAIYRSTDQGESWESLWSGIDDTLYAISFANNLVGLAVGEAGTIISTTDAGLNWSRQESGASRSLRRVQMLSPDVAYVVGDSGTILYTNTGGRPPLGCEYTVGDINGDGSSNGIDILYGISFFKGGAVPAVDCGAPDGPCPQLSPFYAPGDVNGGCRFNGIDLTCYVAYLKGLQPRLRWCADCPPTGVR